jgi:predicted Rossmann fold flavoprotein
VTERDFWGGSPRTVRRVLQAFPAARAAAFFDGLGVRLHEEEDGKLFPDTNRSRTVLEALLAEAARLDVDIVTGERVTSVEPTGGGFALGTQDGGRHLAASAVLATGGLSLPKTGSDGFGYELARRLGHGCVATTPALAPLLLDGDRHAPLSGISLQAALAIRPRGLTPVQLEGALLWTHFGASGPVVLNASRHWHRARLAGHDVDVILNTLPGETFESVDRWLRDERITRPRARVATVLTSRLPAAVAETWAGAAGIGSGTVMAHLLRDSRRRVARDLVETRLTVRDSRGYGHAEVTAGGVPLDEIDSATMQSRVCPRLYLVGEILDVDGRLGGFNFQWAWSSAWVAGHAIARATRDRCG